MSLTKISLNKLSAALLLALASSSANAINDSAYHHEAEVGIADSSGGSDNLVDAHYRYYFKAVEQANKPYALTGFFNQGSTIATGYTTSDSIDIYQFSGQMVFESKWFVGAGISQLKFDYGNNFSFGIDSYTTYAINTGYFITDHSALTLSYSTYSESTSYNNTTPASEIAIYSSLESDNITLSYEHFVALQSTAGIFITGNFSYQNSQNVYNSKYHPLDNAVEFPPQDSKINSDASSITAELNADWYINNAWSIGATYSRLYFDTDHNSSNLDFSYSGNYSENETYTGINTRYFWHFSDVLSAKLSINHSFDNGDFDSDSQTSFGIALNARF